MPINHYLNPIHPITTARKPLTTAHAMLSYAAYKNTRLPPIVNRPMIKLGGGFKLGKPVIGSVPLVQTIHIDGDFEVFFKRGKRPQHSRNKFWNHK